MMNHALLCVGVLHRHGEGLDNRLLGHPSVLDQPMTFRCQKSGAPPDTTNYPVGDRRISQTQQCFGSEIAVCTSNSFSTAGYVCREPVRSKSVNISRHTRALIFVLVTLPIMASILSVVEVCGSLATPNATLKTACFQLNLETISSTTQR